MEAFARLLLQCGLPKRVRIDRDTRFVGAWTSDGYASALIRFLRALNVEVFVCPPRQPWKKPFVERTIYTLKYELFPKHPMNDLAEAREALEMAQHFYHEQRPHQGRACGGKTPNEAFPNLPPLPQVPEMVKPNAWLEKEHARAFRRRVNSSGFIQIDKHRYYIGKEHAKTSVMAHLDAPKKRLTIQNGAQVLAIHPIGGLFDQDTVSFGDYLKQMKLEARSTELHRFMMWHRRGEEAA